MTLIGVKSKYGSGWGTSPGIININNTPKKKSLCKEHKGYLVLWFESIDRLITKREGCLLVILLKKTLFTSCFVLNKAFSIRYFNVFNETL